MYRILTEQRKAAKRLGVTIRPSTLKNKKIDVYKHGFKVASIGDKRYKDYWMYKKMERQGMIPKGTADERRDRRTKYRNYQGFTYADAPKGTRIYNMYQRTGFLGDFDWIWIFRNVPKYYRQFE